VTREFVLISEFERKWNSLGLKDIDLKRLQEDLLLNPESGAVMRGTGGLRKYRFAFTGRGKSGSVRVCYLDIPTCEKLFLITVYCKGEKENLTDEETNDIRKFVIELKSVCKERKK